MGHHTQRYLVGLTTADKERKLVPLADLLTQLHDELAQAAYAVMRREDGTPYALHERSHPEWRAVREVLVAIRALQTGAFSGLHAYRQALAIMDKEGVSMDDLCAGP